jgi:hypothetical protein
LDPRVRNVQEEGENYIIRKLINFVNKYSANNKIVTLRENTDVLRM